MGAQYPGAVPRMGRPIRKGQFVMKFSITAWEQENPVVIDVLGLHMEVSGLHDRTLVIRQDEDTGRIEVDMEEHYIPVIPAAVDTQ